MNTFDAHTAGNNRVELTQEENLRGNLPKQTAPNACDIQRQVEIEKLLCSGSLACGYVYERQYRSGFGVLRGGGQWLHRFRADGAGCDGRGRGAGYRLWTDQASHPSLSPERNGPDNMLKTVDFRTDVWYLLFSGTKK